MKKMLLTAALLFLMLHTFSQAPLNPSISQEAYLQKSKKQKTTAWILLAGSAALITYSYAHPTEGIYIQLPLAAGLFIASVPFFNAAVRNKRKALAVSVSLQHQKRWPAQLGNTGFCPRTAVLLRITI